MKNNVTAKQETAFRAWVCSVIWGDTTNASNPAMSTDSLVEGLYAMAREDSETLGQLVDATLTLMRTAIELGKSDMLEGAIMAQAHFVRVLKAFDIEPSAVQDAEPKVRYLANGDAEFTSLRTAFVYWVTSHPVE